MEMLKTRVLSDENIFLSIYLVDSYIQNKELLSVKDREELNMLRDIFHLTEIKKTIEQVKERLEKVLGDASDYFEVTVFFKLEFTM